MLNRVLSSVDSKRILYDMFKSIFLFVLIFLNLIYVCFVFERIYCPSTLAFLCLWLFLSSFGCCAHFIFVCLFVGRLDTASSHLVEIVLGYE
uniref:Putative ovule protein n=1 Tax=Solanum chacoense TaxID=4108 RepID=A0A0V0IKN0_SOLCH